MRFPLLALCLLGISSPTTGHASVGWGSCPKYLAQQEMSAPSFETAEQVLRYPKIALVVDPVSSGNQVAPELGRRGFAVFYIRPDLRVNERTEKGLIPGHFQNRLFGGVFIEYRGKRVSVSDALESRDFGLALAAVSYLKGVFETNLPKPVPAHDRFLLVPGAESGVQWTGKILAALEMPRFFEDDAISSVRTKPHMYDAVKKNKKNLRIIPHLYTANAEQAVEWARRNAKKVSDISDGRWLIRPGNAMGSTQVKIVETPEEIGAAISELLQQKNTYGQSNRGLMITPYVSDVDEYAVNGACRTRTWVEGVGPKTELLVKVTDVWQYVRPKAPEYGYEKLLDWDEIPAGLLDYHKEVLGALKYVRGFFHFEYFVKRGTGEIFLIEGGARPYGAGDTDISAECTGYGQIEAALDAITDPDKFDLLAKTPYRLEKRGYVINLNGPSKEESGNEKLVAQRSAWAQLGSDFAANIFRLLPGVGDGENVSASTSLLDTMGTVKIVEHIASKEDLPRADRVLNSIRTEIERRRNAGHFWVRQ